MHNLYARRETAIWKNPSDITVAQIENLRKRLNLTRTMQGLGIASLFFLRSEYVSDLYPDCNYYPLMSSDWL